MLAQKQPSFKQCVIADLSSDFAPKMNGTEAVCRNCGLFKKVVEERFNREEARAASDGGPVGSEYPDMSNDKYDKNSYRRKDKVSRARFVRPGLVEC